jgi:hypothetical protein
MLPQYPGSEPATDAAPAPASPLQTATEAVAGKMRFLGYFGVIGGLGAAVSSLLSQPFMVPLHLAVAVAGYLLVRSGNAFAGCSGHERKEEWLEALQSLNRYFTFQFVLMALALISGFVLLIVQNGPRR